ncbi:MepB family protein [Facklamia lactis]|uniref:MepB family protein n=1 Tax=Facklamia lactis TaxID=2749967 RepID=UPI0018CE5C70|nr:MepB family protein [Facklamia lactis]MBG9979433.1 MepB family protein [Facklamia lactis]
MLVIKSKQMIMTYLKINDWLNEVENIEFENQNSEYEGCSFIYKDALYRARMAKITPKKKGAFVAIWQKGKNGKNEPFSVSDSNERLLIGVREENQTGIFDFPVHILENKGLYKSSRFKGKMGFRLYPSWVDELNETAKKSQKWQNDYFTQLSNE